ncbi:hypothetical protein N331_03334, partial [Merops nubicus]
AAIDYLLLAHGHGCQDFEGMCCMNLSDHSKSLYKSTEELRDLVSQLRESDGCNLFSNWFAGL